MPTATHHMVMGYELARDVAGFLATISGLGTLGTDIKVDESPPSPTPLITVHADPGYIATGEVLSSPELRITVRDKKKTLVREKVIKIYEALHRQHPPLERFYAFFRARYSDDFSKDVNSWYVGEIAIETQAHPKTGLV
jgi:hypothetical protein